MAESLGRSKAWVKKWLTLAHARSAGGRIRSCPLEEQQVLLGQMLLIYYWH